MNQKYEKLKALLMELFQLDQPDLDFGIYRILHARSAEISQFLDRDLLPQVRAAFALYQPADKAELEKELAKAIEQAKGLGVEDPETTPKVRDLRARLKSDAVDIGALENEVYDSLFSFFRRYYSEGDFLSKRVYKAGVYAIPYEGEEVKFHWANADQYYIKTSEYLRDYAFRLRPEVTANPMRVHFRLVDAAEGEHGNVKEAKDNERRFILVARDFIAVEDVGQSKELVIRFEFRPATLADWPQEVREGKAKPPAQKDLTALAEARVLAVTDVAFAEWLVELGKSHTKADGTQADYTRLRAHLNRYAARNTFDYFIHKDLGKFLRRELDFYIKNEVMHLDDIEIETAPRVEQYLSKLRVIRHIARRIIDFLAQLEDFQKKLWQKKKFVVETSWLIPTQSIPVAFWPDIPKNRAQLDQWKDQLAIEPKEFLGKNGELDMAYIEGHPTLVVDTRLFPSDWTQRLLESLTFADLDDATDGILIHSENYQAMCLLGERFREQIKCIYIDPPYNTESSGIPYKNNYRHSTYSCMLHDRLAQLWSLTKGDGAIFVSIDKTERTVLEHALDDTYGIENRIEELVWSMNTTNSQAPNYSTNHEYVEVYARNRRVVEQARDMFREPKPGFEEVMGLVSRLNPEYPPVTVIEAELKSLYDQHKTELREEIEAQGKDWDEEKGRDPWRGLFNYCRAEYRDELGALVPENQARAKLAKIWVYQAGDASMPASKQSPSTRDPAHPNYRFYKPLHPLTGSPCPYPKSGWKYALKDDDASPERKSFLALDRDHRIAWGLDHTKVPRVKRMLHEVETNIGKSVFEDFSDGEKQTSALFGRSGVFLAPKHSSFVSRFIWHATKGGGFVLDCFGGTGSTGHAAIDVGRADGKRRRFVVAEFDRHFDSLIVPRIAKVMFTPEWKDGKPRRMATKEEAERTPRLVKVLRLESYEDALNNLETRRTEAQQTLLDAAAAQGPGGFREQYLLRYALDVETRGSQSLLNVQAFTDPTAYKLKVKRPSSDESREVNVDLLETFNWLVGLTVQHIAAPQCFSATFERDGEGRLRLKGRLKQDDAGPWWFRAVTGTMPGGRGTLIIWRKRPGGEAPEGIEQDNLVLNEWFTKQGYSTKDFEFQVLYVNGDNNLENLKAPDDTWKVRLIEDDFHRLMFEEDNS